MLNDEDRPRPRPFFASREFWYGFEFTLILLALVIVGYASFQ